ncbi:hypothetical protein [Nocardia terpenica]|uniref:hypothetical protein n=1 Tax=Nocardia terpenica TaxID=455432 RepID=UPI0012FE22A5|nr:hypothetical protein [Nocardia terpenica]
MGSSTVGISRSALARTCSRLLTEEVAGLSELAREVREVAARRLGRTNRSVRGALLDADWEIRALAHETTELLDAALRARADRLRQRRGTGPR